MTAKMGSKKNSATMNATTIVKTAFRMRARSSRRWSDSAIRPSSPMGWTGLPMNSRATPGSDMRWTCGWFGSGVLLAMLVDDLAVGDVLRGVQLTEGVGFGPFLSSSLRPLVSALKIRSA